MPDQTPSLQPAPLSRRIGAMLYDAILLLGVLMLAVLVLIFPYHLVTGQPFPHGEPIHLTVERLYLLLVSGGFFVFFWTHGGQTLGMRTWRLRAIRDDGAPLRARDAWRRFAWAIPSLAPLGLGLWWSLVDRDRLAWHDRLSRTRLVRLPPGAD
jgi:uncharacterized RDD family membrane protein YckC